MFFAGYVADGKPVLKSWDENIWCNGVVLEGNLKFYDLKNLKQIFTEFHQYLSAVLSSSGNIFVVRSSQTWSATGSEVAILNIE